MSKKKSRSLQDILRDRQQEEFVGREDQLAFFQANLGYDVDDPRRRFIINISGQGGVGKTWLLRRFQKIAEEAGAITACTDEAEEDVPSVMGRIAERFESQGYTFKAFAERHKVYRQRRQEIEADPEAPQGFPAFIGRTLTKGGLYLARQVPVGGLIAEFLDEDALVSLGDECVNYVVRRIRNKDEVQLVLEPLEILTPLFLSDLGNMAGDHTAVFFFDTFERTNSYLDPWFQDLLEGRYGNVPANILLVVAGRDEANRNLWAPYEGLLTRLPLEPFTDKEAHNYLARKGVTDAKVVQVILYLSGQLPLLVATLAAESPTDPTKVGDPSGEAVERFLKWVDVPLQRQVALDAALPRRLDRDVLATLVGEDQANTLFAWIRKMPFTEKVSEGWAYHEVVRVQMLRFKRRESLQGWTRLHGRIADFYEKLQADMELDAEAGRKNKSWRAYRLETLYHRLCQQPHQHISTAVTEFLSTLRDKGPFAQRWAETILQAGRDVEAEEVEEWGYRLVKGLKAHNEAHFEEAASLFSPLLGWKELNPQWRPVALDWLGDLYFLAEQYDLALANLNEAIELRPANAEFIAHRGSTHRELYQYDKALADYNQAIELDPDYAWAIVRRSDVHRLLKRYDEALADLDRVIEIQPDHPWAIAGRGNIYRSMKRYDEALTQFNTAIDLAPDYAWAIAHRGDTYRLMRRYEEALADLDHAIKLQPDYPGAIGTRGVVYLQTKCYTKALEAFEQAIQLRPNLDWAIAGRGETYRSMGRYEEALADLNRALEIQPNMLWALAGRGRTYLHMGCHNKALADFDSILELEPANDWCLYCRALVHQARGQMEAAEADLSAAIKAAEDKHTSNSWEWRNILRLALYHLTAGHTREAECLYREALPHGAPAYRARIALVELNDFLPLFPSNAPAQPIRDLLQKCLQEAQL